MTTAHQPSVKAITNVKAFFDRTTSCFSEEDSQFRPEAELFTVAHHVAHVAQTVDWFLEGAFGDGFDMDFEEHERKVRAVGSLKEARAWLDRSMEKAMEVLGSKSFEELDEPYGPGLFEGAPKGSLVQGIADHTAHHRGALTVYARLLGKVPPMPYA